MPSGIIKGGNPKYNISPTMATAISQITPLSELIFSFGGRGEWGFTIITHIYLMFGVVFLINISNFESKIGFCLKILGKNLFRGFLTNLLRNYQLTFRPSSSLTPKYFLDFFIHLNLGFSS